MPILVLASEDKNRYLNPGDILVWDQREVTLAIANFGKVTRMRTDSQGREVQIGVRFVF
jgi:hypothetical protein